MQERQKSTHIKPRQIVGFNLSPELADEVKMEAACRGLSLKHLFEEMWAQYRKEQEETDHDARKSR